MHSSTQETPHLNAQALLHPDLAQSSLIELLQQITQHYLADENSFMEELVKIVNHSPEDMQRLKSQTAELVKMCASRRMRLTVLTSCCSNTASRPMKACY